MEEMRVSRVDLDCLLRRIADCERALLDVARMQIRTAEIIRAGLRLHPVDARASLLRSVEE